MFSQPVVFLTLVAPAILRTAIIIITEHNCSDLVKRQLFILFIYLFVIIKIASLMIRDTDIQC